MSGATRRELIEGFVPASPFAEKLGIRLERVETESAELSMPFDPSLATAADVVHGGAITSLLDTAGTVAAWANDDVPSNLHGSTVGLSIDFVAAAQGTDLRARAEVIRRGKRLCFVEVTVIDSHGDIVAKGLVTHSYG